MKIFECEQGSEEWLNIRLGKVTASEFKSVLAGGAGKTRHAYMLKLAAEILTGESIPGFKNSTMEWGNETEPQACAIYQLNSGNDVEKVGFVQRDENVGVSPDRLVGDNGLLEVKCPITTTQIERYLKGVFPSEYNPQVQGQLWVCERDWCDFVSFDPRINGPASYFRIRVQRDEEYIKKIEIETDKFVNELHELIEKLK